MKVSYTWLQTYFKEPLPAPEKLADILTFHVFEIEGIEKHGDDTVLDVKVLPDRANYALSHQGIAREISATTGMNIQNGKFQTEPVTFPASKLLDLDIRDERCFRNLKVVIQNVNVGASPAWLKDSLETVGQRSISNMVDATNYVMFDMGQPMHIFDFDKLVKKDDKVKIVLKKADNGTVITTLGGKQYTLDGDVLIFADGNNNDLPLDIAGVKGGTAAEVDTKTKNIVVLSDIFDASYIRKTSMKLGIRTDASKRYENSVPIEQNMLGMKEYVRIIKEMNPQAVVEGIVEYYPKRFEQKSITVARSYISKMLGIDIVEKEFEDILNRLNFSFTNSGEIYTITPPYYRLDVNIKQDLVEEVGRIFGYDKIPATLLPEISFKPAVIKDFYYQNKIRDILVDLGFSEVYTYSFGSQGEVEMEKPLASDKKYLRPELSFGFYEALTLNARNADLLGLDQIKIFEIGKVFVEGKEKTALAIGVKNIKKQKSGEGMFILEAYKTLSEKIGLEFEPGILASQGGQNIFSQEIYLDEALEKLPDPTSYDPYPPIDETIKFKTISQYPFAVRDIAVFTPEGTTEAEVRAIIEKEAGILLVKNRLFDVFTKKFPDGTSKTSYAFRLVLLSYERTLTEDEINAIMKKITDTMNAKSGWQVR